MRRPSSSGHHHTAVRGAALAALAIAALNGAVAAPAYAATPAPACARPAGPVPAPGVYALGTFNMAGGAAGHGDSDATACALSKSIRSRGMDIVFLQETCRHMIDQLKAYLPRGWRVAFHPTPGATCKPRPTIFGAAAAPTAFGIGIAYNSSRLPVKQVLRAHDLPSTGHEQRALKCVDIATPRPLLACTTHLTSQPGTERDNQRREQVSAIATFFRHPSWWRHAIALGGDMNTTPGTRVLNPLWDKRYGLGAVGSMVEVDSGPNSDCSRLTDSRCYNRQSGEPTHSDGKFDYIFVRGMGVLAGQVGETIVSDHRPLWGWARLAP